MAKAKVQINQSLANLKMTLSAGISSGGLLSEIAEFCRSRIYQYTKRGQSLVQESKLQALSTGYIEYRKRLTRAKKSRSSKKTRQSGVFPSKGFGAFFSPSRSNLTLTGQLLEALKSRVKKSSNQIEVFVENSSRSDSDLTNKEVAEKVSSDGRPFIGLDRVGRDRVRRLVIAQLRRSFKRR